MTVTALPLLTVTSNGGGKPDRGDRLVEFVEAQADSSVLEALGVPPGFLFVPPVPNFFGSNEPGNPIAMSFDYAGLADKTCGGIAGTTFDGFVKETKMPDGRALVKVRLITKNAIAWAIEGTPVLDEETGEPTGEYSHDYGTDPVVFGTRWSEDEDGGCFFDGPLALGTYVLDIEYISPNVGDPMPSLFDLLLCPIISEEAFPDLCPVKGREFLSWKIRAVAEGFLDDGSSAVAGTDQFVKDTNGELGVIDEDFIIERVFIRPPGQR